MRPLLALLLAAGIAACNPTPEDRLRDSLPEDGEEGPTHRPGQPCNVCHDFALAGTVYRYVDDGPHDGLEGAQVTITDEAGHELVATTNRVGTFFVTVDDGGEPEGEGHYLIPWKPRYPLHVQVTYLALEQEMRNVIHREGSCGLCHTGEVGAESAGRVFVEERP